jgi:Uri superfamily endonuclease
METKNDTAPAHNDLAVIISRLPVPAGSYVLQLHLSRAHQIQVGKFAQAIFPAGEYIYLGSALGPGGLRARLGRHLRATGKHQWHIDYLRSVADVHAMGYGLARDEAGNQPMECAWSQALVNLPGAFIPLAGFGAGDCRSGCQAHLVGFPVSSTGMLENLQKIYSLAILNCRIPKTPGALPDHR